MMSSHHNLPQGYDYDFKDKSEIPDALVCQICTFVARDPQQVVCCGRVYCKACLERVLQDSMILMCPQCRAPVQSFPDTKSEFSYSSNNNNSYRGIAKLILLNWLTN